MSSTKILVVDDELTIRTLVRRYLEREGYQVEIAENGETALRIFDQMEPELVVLDLMLPDINGYELCQRMQSRTNVYVLMLTARADEADKVQGFALGADDYLTKPFSLKELSARISAILKRQRTSTQATEQVLKYQAIAIDPVRREVRMSGTDLIELTALEFDLLYLLAQAPGKVWRRSDLIREVWGYDYVGDERVVDVHIGQIRKKLESNTSEPIYVKTVRGVGYKFDEGTGS
ncbi:response regulator transcription factor [Candidatus Cyanaurora vandensis]|uniref:response regulator transcription factor n=1 Tax=Candidatus Cyanaurora vandensis TaxID=2714958 RepID=UPI00257E0D23|nr:response regulator transcription factor [Candidatus Cyanaurora vandensis]